MVGLFLRTVSLLEFQPVYSRFPWPQKPFTPRFALLFATLTRKGHVHSLRTSDDVCSQVRT